MDLTDYATMIAGVQKTIFFHVEKVTNVALRHIGVIVTIVAAPNIQCVLRRIKWISVGEKINTRPRARIGGRG